MSDREFFATLKNPKYNSLLPETAMIFLDGILNGKAVKFVASKDDPNPFGRDVYKAAVQGQFGPISEYAPPPPDVKVNNPTKVISLEEIMIRLDKLEKEVEKLRKAK